MCKVRVAIQSLNTTKVQALFALAGIDVFDVTEIENQYWPESYTELRAANPWFKVLTSMGTVTVGKRKRVYVIDWTDTSVRHIVTEDHVSKDETYVHAWTLGKAADYLALLRQHVDQPLQENDDESSSDDQPE